MKKYRKNIKGEKFNYLTAIVKIEKQKWLFLCDCGIKKIIIKDNVINGHTKSCGCIYGKNKTTHNLSKSKEYNIYYCIIKRCYNKNYTEYEYYGKRGIKVCDRWINSFENFLEDMGKRPSKSHSIDRIDNNGNYCKENCRWATKKEQARNNRHNKLLKFNNKIKTLPEHCEELNLNYPTIKTRIYTLKWDIDKALSTPIKCKVKNV